MGCANSIATAILRVQRLKRSDSNICRQVLAWLAVTWTLCLTGFKAERGSLVPCREHTKARILSTQTNIWCIIEYIRLLLTKTHPVHLSRSLLQPPACQMSSGASCWENGCLLISPQCEHRSTSDLRKWIRCREIHSWDSGISLICFISFKLR